MAGTLYLVATPIGNLGDLSPRAVETLRTADFIAAEDTRVSLRLLNHFDIRKPLVSYHEHNRAAAGPAHCGASAGGGELRPGDGRRNPGHQRSRRGPGAPVRTAGHHRAGHPRLLRRRVRPGGVGAAHRAILLRGVSVRQQKGAPRRLEELRGEERTMVFHEAPHKLRPTLADMLEVLGDRPVALCRELTKLHEETVRTTLSRRWPCIRRRSPEGSMYWWWPGPSGPPGPP